MEFITKCKCDCEFNIARNTKQENYDKFILTTYSCPECGKVYVGQVDNETTREIVFEMVKIYAHISTKFCNEKNPVCDIPERYKKILSKLDSELKTERKIAVEQYLSNPKYDYQEPCLLNKE